MDMKQMIRTHKMNNQDWIHLRATKYANDCKAERERIGYVKLDDDTANRLWLAHYEGFRDGYLLRKKHKGD